MNTRLAVAIHILTFLQTRNGEPTTSELIAASINTNPSLVRRLLSQLAKAGLTTSQMGTGGGALLARPATEITLLDAYRATAEDGAILGVHSNPNPACPVGRNIRKVLLSRFQSVEEAFQLNLSGTTIANMVSEVLEKGASGQRKAPDKT